MSNQNSFSLRSVLEKDKLNGSNFLDWYRNLRIVLKQERKDYVLEKALPEKLRSNASHAVYDAWNKHYYDVVDVSRLMRDTMNSELQGQYENVESPIEIVTSLKAMFQEQTRTERYQTVKSLFECKLPKDAPVSPHVMKMMGYIDNLRRLDCPVSQELATDIILQSLPTSYDEFIKYYVKNVLTKTLTELHNMLKTAELNIKKGKRFQKPGKDKGDRKAVQIMNQDKPGSINKPKSGPSDDDTCSYCEEPRHWRRKCKKYLEDSQEIMKMYETSSGIYVTSSSILWVLDTGCGAHICLNMQSISNSRTLKKGQMEMLNRNEARVAALAVGSFHFVVAFGLGFRNYVIAIVYLL